MLLISQIEQFVRDSWSTEPKLSTQEKAMGSESSQYYINHITHLVLISL